MALLRSIFLQHGLLYMLLGGLAFTLIFQGAYQDIAPDLYEYRDDGVITMSHGKNFVDHGHIGVNPSGERVEGFSAPVQFWLYSAAYALFGTSYQGFADSQTLLCTFLLGFFFVGIFHQKYLWGFLWSLPMGWFLTQQSSFLEWHSSGMENAMTHVLLFASIFVLTRQLEKGQIRRGTALLLAAAALSRIESIYHIGPLLFLFAMAFRREKRSWKGYHLMGYTLGIWALYHLWRAWYFGTFEPNTGAAQHISVGENISATLRRLDHVGRSLVHGQDILSAHGGIWLLLLFPVLPFLNWKPRTQWIFFLGMSLALTSFLNPFVFGESRLDATRTTTFLAPVFALLLAHLIPRIPVFKKRLSLLFGFACALLVFVLSPYLKQEPEYICCSILRYEPLAEAAREIGEEKELHRVNLATADLGKISYLKEFNITDMGLLGSPLMAEYFYDRDQLEIYFLEFARPDFIELHEHYLIDYTRLLLSERFNELYAPLEVSRTPWLQEHAGHLPTLMDGYFVRRDLHPGNPEWQLIQDLRQQLSVARIRQELATTVRRDDPRAHQYVVRTVYRFLPELKSADLYDEVLDLFAETPSADYDQAWLASAYRRRWKQQAMDFLDPYLTQAVATRQAPHIPAKARRIYNQNRRRTFLGPQNELVFAFLQPTAQDSLARFHLHLHGPDQDGVPSEPQYLDFTMDPAQISVDRGELFYQIQLPATEVGDYLIFGQHTDQGLIWEGKHLWTPPRK